MNKITELAARCKGGVGIYINDHLDNYKSLDEYIDILNNCCNDKISDETKAEIIKNNMLVELIISPETPIGSYKIVHWDVELAVEEALRILDEDN